MLNASWDFCVLVASENALPCHDREGYNYLAEKAKPTNDPDGRHFSSFTYLRLSPLLMERHNFLEFERFVKRMHGKRLDVFILMSPDVTTFIDYCYFSFGIQNWHVFEPSGLRTEALVLGVPIHRTLTVVSSMKIFLR